MPRSIPLPIPAHLLALAALTLHLPAQTDWFRVASPVSPPARTGAAMASDPVRRVSILFGGTGAQGPLGDTWELSGTTWTRVNTASSPPARSDARMVYDWARRIVVLFGGTAGSASQRQSLADLWEYDGSDWKQVRAASAPPPRGGHGMVFDFIRSVVVVFGGARIAAGGTTLLGDTWEWHGTGWVRVATTRSPPPRVDGGMAFLWNGDSLLFGGTGGTGALGDTWIHDGKDWTLQAPANSPGAQAAEQLTYDQRRDRTVLLDAGSISWEWDGKDWRKLATSAAPSRRVHPGMVFDLDTGRTVLFGGRDAVTSQLLADTWIYQATQPAAASSYGRACGRTTLHISASGLPWIGAPMLLLILNVPARQNALLAFGASDKLWNGVKLPLDLGFLGAPGCALLTSLEFVDPVYSPNGVAAKQYQVPNAPWLVGQHMYVQALGLAPGTNPAGFVTTNGLKLTFGSR